ncbi:stage II sporulation protein M [Sorangium sp. So ce1128]
MAFTLRSYTFRKEREASFRELEGLVDRIEKRGLSALGPEELYRLPALYRGALSALSVARAITLDKNIVAYLESLTARAYVCVYGTKRRFGDAVGEFFRARFPALVYRMRWGVLLAAFVLALGALTSFFITRADPERFYSFVGTAMAAGRSPASSREELAAVLVDDGGAADALAGFSTFLFTNNAKVGLLCFALGFAAGVPVLLVLFTNGLALGAMAAIYASKGLGLDFVAWVMPHGVTELLGVCVAGAAGLSIGAGVVFPGRYGRLESLAERGREAGAVAVGTVALFFVAALIEGIFRQLVHANAARAALAVATAVVWLVYFGRFAWRKA